jgi:ubiquinol-cytochrome c reductase cytochrome c1 subunit
MKKFLLAWMMFAALLSGVQAAGGGFPLDKFPKERLSDLASLQNGAKLFVNYCVGCHEAAFLRYNRMKDIGLTEAQIKQNLMFGTDKVGDTMKVALSARNAKEWFGATPPDLTLVARSRAGSAGSGPDYLYTYLRTFYRDDTRPTGWNNMVFPNVGMPHALWELQGQRSAKFVEKDDPHNEGKKVHAFEGYESLSMGTLSTQAYDSQVADLVAFMTWMAEPQAQSRVRIGVGVMIFLFGFFFIAWRLNASFWKDVK